MNILFTSVGNLAFPTIYNELKKRHKTRIKIVGVDVRHSAHGLYFCDKAYLVAKRANLNLYLNQILRIVKSEKIEIIFPLSTEDQDFYSTRIKYFNDLGVKIICSDNNEIAISNNKKLLYDKISTIHLQPTSINFSNIKKEQAVVIKKQSGTGGTGTFIVSNSIHNLKEDDRKFFVSQNDFFNNVDTYYDSTNSIITEYLPGREFSVDLLCFQGKLIYGVVRERFKSVGGLALETTVIRNDELIGLSKKVLGLIPLSFIVNFQFKQSVNNEYKLIDINPRIPGTLSLSLASGGDFIYDSIKLISRKSKVKKPKIKYQMSLYRYWDGVIVDNQMRAKVKNLNSK